MENMEHAGHPPHDHSAHASPAMDMSSGGHDMSHSAVGRHPDGSYYYTHGAYLGHMVPGCFFIAWGLWWMVATHISYLQATVTRRPFASRSWYRFWFGPAWLRRAPVEPIIKIVCPFFGILGELWLGHPSWRTLMGPDHKFVVDNVNDWQHSAMYSAFITSGVVDLLGHIAGLPLGTERGFVGLAFLCEGLLLAFHLKGPPIEYLVHYILVLIIFATAVAVVAEGLAPGSNVVASLRPALTLLQGVWWVQTAHIMYTANPAFDPDEMGGTMMTPVVLVMHMLWIAVLSLSVLVGLRALQARLLGRQIHFTPLKSSDSSTRGGGESRGEGYGDEEMMGREGSVELAPLTLQK